MSRPLILELRRIYEAGHYTVGLLQLGIHVFTTLEDAYHSPKILGQTRIPPGRYRIELRRGSPMAARYTRKFGAEHEGMIWVRDVPDFKYVYIHIGNGHTDTEGCILVGNTMTPAGGFVGESVSAYRKIFPLVMGAIEDGTEVQIRITDQYT